MASLVEEIQAEAGPGGVEKLQPKPPMISRRGSVTELLTGVGRLLSSGANSGAAGQSPSSTSAEEAADEAARVEEARRLMRASANVLQIGGLMMAHSSVREVQMEGFDALVRAWAASSSSASSSYAPSAWALKVAEGYIEAVVGGMQAHLDDVEVQQKGASALQVIGRNKAFEEALKDKGGVAAVKLAIKHHPASFSEGVKLGGVVLKSSWPMVRRFSEALHFSASFPKTKRLASSQGD
ncbi:hypothetical protein T484DRAFT_1776024 [Baffinella frigidus]|nr:hypothetical protein T484DRAFT_1776024 [Cryptophyta sp. CCMP2293]